MISAPLQGSNLVQLLQTECTLHSSSRAARARERVVLAREALKECSLCAHNCGVNRLAGELGLCRAGADARIFSAQIEVGDELELVPTFAIAFSGCDLRCDFCITGESSWNPRAGEPVQLRRLAKRARAALAAGVRTIMFLGGEPTIHLSTALEIAAILPLTARLVWKTNGHASRQALAWLADVFDIWLVDYKFGNDDCASRLARVQNYTAVVRENLLWAANHGELIVRHLLMPGHFDCCWWPIAEWLRDCLPGVKVSLRAAFWPAWKAARHPELQRTVSAVEAERASALAADFDLNLIP